MKNILSGIVIIAFIALAFFIGKGCSTDDITQSAINELKAQIPPLLVQVDKLKKDKVILVEIIDSLKKIPAQIDTRIVYLQSGVDSAIAKDSLNAITEYRKGLNLLEIRTESTPALTLREIGIGAYTFRETYGMRLKIPVLNETIDTLSSLVMNLEKTVVLKDRYIVINHAIMAAQDLLIKELDGFWVNRFIFYIGVGANYDGKTLAPGLQMGVGIRIIGND